TQSGNADGSESDLTKYGLDSNTVSSGLAFQLLYDDRRNSINPDRGTYVQFRYRTSFEWLGSTNNWQSVLIDARKFIPWGNKG
ncbi:BamA/TamA family outer membrane protein, partial [Shewanella algae]|uniref:BamA/TamA family outer membrane protein n=1 Tax=Shewanella algae TaxID=38313 RepID=UPI00313BE7E4